MLANSVGKKVFITGCSGFTGKILASQLAKDNYQVFGNEYNGDIADYQNLLAYVKNIKPDFVVHLAAISGVVNQDEEKLYKINLFGTLNLLQALDEAKVQPQKIIIASSAYIYGNCSQQFIPETVCPQPINHYGASKLAMEHIVSTWFDRFPIIITRPFNYTGVGQSFSFIIPKIIDNFREKKLLMELGNIAVTRDISDVNFVVEAYARLLNSNIDSEIFNLCSGLGYTITEILDLMAKISGYTLEIKINPDFFRKNEIHRLVGSHKKLFDAVGEIPIVPLQKTLQHMYESE